MDQGVVGLGRGDGRSLFRERINLTIDLVEV